MNGRRELPAGPLVAALGAVLLLVSLFLDWYEARDEDLSFSGWTSFEVLDLLLAALAVAALLAALARFGLPRWVPARALPALGAAALVIVGSQLINHPPLFTFAEAELEVGAWLAFIGSLLMLAGGVITVARVSVAVNVGDRAPDAAPGAGVPPPAPAPAPSGPAPGATAPMPDPTMPPPGAGAPPPGATAPYQQPPPAQGPDDQTQRLPGQ